MRATDVIRQSLDLSDKILHNYIDDLSEADLKLIPIPGMNPIALQLGHLISSERMFLEAVKPGSSPPLPEGFDAKHSLKEGKPEDMSRFTTKEQYRSLHKAQRDATKSYLDSLTDDQLDAAAPEQLRKMAPTVGAILNMTANHVLMHLGQFVAVRRQLKKPIAF